MFGALSYPKGRGVLWGSRTSSGAACRPRGRAPDRAPPAVGVQQAALARNAHDAILAHQLCPSALVPLYLVPHSPYQLQ
jgi:hypothetical protein